MGDHQNHIRLSTTMVHHQLRWSTINDHGRPSTTGVDRWGTGGRVPHFSGWGTAQELSPPLFSSEKKLARHIA